MGGLQGIGRLSKVLKASGATVLPGVTGAAWAKKSEAARQELVAGTIRKLGLGSGRG
jgi:hypothetical protein